MANIFEYVYGFSSRNKILNSDTFIKLNLALCYIFFFLNILVESDEY